MERRAAIDADALMKKSLNEISAADFIRLLGRRELAGISVVLADKKKLELWVDEGPIFETPIEAVLDKIKGEKKKLELELPYDSPIIDPGPLRQINYTRLVQDVAAVVEKQMLEKQAIRLPWRAPNPIADLAPNSACAAVVDDQPDTLAASVAGELQRLGMPVRHVPAGALGLLDLRVDRNEVLVDGARLAAVFFRAGPWTQFAEGFRADDVSFASMEVSSAWLAIQALPNIAACNRLDAELWTTRAEWAVWRRRLLAAGIPCVDLDVGAVDGEYTHWLPWGGGIADPPGEQSRRLFASALTRATGLVSSVWFRGRTFPETRSPPELGELMGRHGIELAGMTTDADGRVALLTAHPAVDEPTAKVLAPLIAQRLAERVLATA